jgi:AraC family ethanolamine operon transcriptional activator
MDCSDILPGRRRDLSSPDREPSGPPLFLERCATIEARNRLQASDYDADFAPFGGAPFRSRLCGLDVAGMRVTAVRDEGGVRMRAAWHEDAFGAVFIWGDGATVERTRHDRPRLVVAGPGTEVTTGQNGVCHNLRIGVRGRALADLRADPAAAPHVEPWLRPGIFRPAVDAAREWRLQEKIVQATSFVERAVARRVDVEPALAVLAQEVTGALLELLGDAAPGEPRDRTSAHARRQLVEAALDALQAASDEPVSVAATCRRLGVSERTLQRAFHECLGVGLRAYEREQRLRGVHGAILAHGDRRTVTDIAMSFGFWHLGRFAGAYRALFGCSPAETRRRVWDAVPTSTRPRSSTA